MANLSAARAETSDCEPTRDALGIWTASSAAGELCCMVLAQGKGDLGRARYASSFVVRAFEHWFRDDLARAVLDRGNPLDVGAVARGWESVLSHTHAHLLTKAACAGGAGCAASVVACMVLRDEFLVVQVGDCRLFTLKGAEIFEVTQDEGFVEMLVVQGELSADEAMTHPARMVTSQAVGSSVHLCPVFVRDSLYGAELFVAVTSDLANAAGAARIRDTFGACTGRSDEELAGACSTLVDACGPYAPYAAICCLAPEPASKV